MQYTDLIWRNEQPYNEMFDDIYYSSSETELVAGESEFNHVFLKHNGLPERWQTKQDFVIAELGFGSGLNCVLTIREWLKQPESSTRNKRLHYIAIENYPLSPEAIKTLLCRYPELKNYCDELLDNYPPAVAGTHSRHLFDSRVIIHYKFSDAYEALKDEQLNVDAWYLDGFSPAKNSAMWSERLFLKLAQNSYTGTTCSTYTAAGFVRRNLKAAGFKVNKVTGHGKKREMLTAIYSGENDKALKFKDRPWYALPDYKSVSERKATIIGAGIAGLAVAYALVKRGWQVTVIDKCGDIAKQASSNPAPIIYPRLSVNNDVDSEFFTAAYCYVVYLLEKLQRHQQEKFWFGDGLQQLMDKKRISQIISKFQFNKDFLSIIEDIDNVQCLVEYVSAGVLLPAVLCEVLKKECANNLTLITAEVTDIQYENNAWLCSASSGQSNKSEVLIIANGTDINRLGLQQDFPVESIRGQVVTLNANAASRQIKKTLNSSVHITPVINNKHYLGATYTRQCKNPDICDEDNTELFDALNSIYPTMFDEHDYSDTWVGFRTMSKDRVPIVGGLPDVPFFNKEYADLRHGKTNKSYRSGQYLNGLYITAAHGSRGFTSSFLSAEIIASQIMGEPSPVSKRVMDYLNPSRFIVNDLKRG